MPINLGPCREFLLAFRVPVVLEILQVTQVGAYMICKQLFMFRRSTQLFDQIEEFRKCEGGFDNS